MLKGTFTALVTPFDQEGHLDERGLKTLLEHQLESKVEGIVVIGSTGESATLSDDEKTAIIRIAKECIGSRKKLIVGTGCNCTKKTIEATKRAASLGADAALVVTPYYNKPTQEGLFEHYEKVASSSDLPLILYNVPGRCAVNLLPQTVQKLSKIPTIAGIKEASGSLPQMMELLELLPEFPVLSGDDILTLPLLVLGGQGVISVVSNLVPDDMAELVRAGLNHRWDEARKIHFQLLPLFRGAFIETNPIPIKSLMRFAGLPAGPCRLPLTMPDAEHERKLRHLYETLKLPLLTHG